MRACGRQLARPRSGRGVPARCDRSRSVADILRRRPSSSRNGRAKLLSVYESVPGRSAAAGAIRASGPLPGPDWDICATGRGQSRLYDYSADELLLGEDPADKQTVAATARCATVAVGWQISSRQRLVWIRLSLRPIPRERAGTCGEERGRNGPVEGSARTSERR